jgi:hypothetical protein
MPLQLDHVFSFCEPELPEAARFENEGLIVNKGRDHQGQGTANRCVLFSENYFEMIFLRSEKEASVNPLRLDLRSNWRTTGASPFGIALRGELSPADRDEFWVYNPPYAPGSTILICKTNESQPRLPLIFVMETSGPKKESPAHRLGTTRIESLIAFSPGGHWPLSEKVNGVRIESAPRPHLHLHLDGHEKRNFAINELCSFAVDVD